MSNSPLITEGAEITLDNTGEQYICPYDTVLLDAGLAAGLHIPHNCRGGACGTCKAKVLEGSVDHGWVMSFAISDEEKAEGYCLTCQSKPTAPAIRLQMVNSMHAREAGEDVIIPAEFTADVVAAHDVTPSVRRIVLSVPPTVRFHYRPGMNLEFLLPGIEPARPYSIANAPKDDGSAKDGQLTFYVTRHPHGAASQRVHELAPGDTLAVRGPYGDFHLPSNPPGPVLALAGGTGLSPILAVIEGALRAGLEAPVELLFSVRERRELFALETLTALARRFPHFTYRITVTREDSDLPNFLRGRCTALLEQEKPQLGGMRILIAGPPGFVDDCSAAVKACGAGPDAIAVDSFLPRIAPAPAS
jgi:CDP-4-dehydro-6-deoxyglucose reductase